MRRQLKVSFRPNNQISLSDYWINEKKKSRKPKIDDPLDLNKHLQRGKEIRSGYGIRPLPISFSRHTGQKIREAGAAIDILCQGDPRRARVITLTLPSKHKRAYQEISNYSAYIVNRLFQPIRREQTISGWFFVWEYQKRGALHLHICFHNQDRLLSYKLGEKIVEQWYKILDWIQEKTKTPMFAQSGKGFCKVAKFEAKSVNQTMRKGCGAYFSKYAAKTSNKKQTKELRRNAQKYPVTRFYGSSDSVKLIIKEYSFELIIDTTEEEIEKVKKEWELRIRGFDIVKEYEYSWSKSIAYMQIEYIVTAGSKRVFYLHACNYLKLLMMPYIVHIKKS